MVPPSSVYVDKQIAYESPSTRVYRAIRSGDNLPVAIKTLQGFTSAESRQGIEARLREEFEALASVQSPWVIRPIEVIGRGSDCGLVMHFAEHCQPLVHLCANERLSVSASLTVAIALTKALAATHRAGIVHKDVKPHNVLVNRDLSQVFLIDFGIACRTVSEQRPLAEPSAIQGSLPYLAPEQSGRMDRSIDHRSDYYALGVTLYEILTGHLPFDEVDPGRLVYAHLARTPVPVHERNPNVARGVSAIVSKLMAKGPDQRYQGSHGLLRDLEHCLRTLREGDPLDDFVPGTRDHSERFIFAKGLYGRSREVSQVRDIFTRVACGSAGVITLAGASGVGKSSLVASSLIDLTAHDGFFLHAKFDLHKRNDPYRALLDSLAPILHHLGRRLDTRDASRLRQVESALQPHGRVLTGALPELVELFPALPALPALSGHDHAALFFRTLTSVFAVLAASDHPLLLFVDDLQWADHASLDLLRALINPPTPYLLLVVAYRPQEIESSGPLRLFLHHLGQAQVELAQLELGPLGIADTLAFLRDTLHQAPECEPLALALHQRTQGHPLFMEQVLQALHAAGNLWMSADTGVWTWNLDAVHQIHASEGLVELLLERLRTLPPESLELLGCAALLGTRFHLPLLARALGLSLSAAKTRALPALIAGFLIPLDDEARLIGGEHDDALITLSESFPNAGPGFRFAHDRIQQAVLQIVADRRDHWHWRIVDALLTRTPAQPSQDWITRLLSHALEIAATFNEPTERLRLLQWTVQSAQRALANGAPRAALDLLAKARPLVPEDAWTRVPHSLANPELNAAADVMLDFELARLGANFLIGEHETCETELAALCARCRTRSAFARVARLRIEHAAIVGNHEHVVRLWLELLQHFDRPLPREPSLLRAAWAYAHMRRALVPKRLAARRPNDRSDPETEILFDCMLVALSSLYHLGMMKLYVVVLHHMLPLALAQGRGSAQPTLVSIFAVLRSGRSGDYAQAWSLCEFALHAVALAPNPRRECYIWLNRGLFATVWNRGWQETRRDFAQTYALAEPIGEAWVAALALAYDALVALFDGTSLDAVRLAITRSVAYASRVKEWSILPFSSLQDHLCTTFQGSVADAVPELVANREQQRNHPGTLRFLTATLRLIEAVHLNDWESAWHASEDIDRYLAFGAGMPAHAPALVYRVVAAHHFRQHPQRRQRAHAFVRSARTLIERWQKCAPQVAAPWSALVQAMNFHLADDPARLAALDVAIRTAQVHELPHLTGLAAALACDIVQSQGERAQPSLLHHYLQAACEAYQTWGASGLRKQRIGIHHQALPSGAAQWIAEADPRRLTIRVTSTTSTNSNLAGSKRADQDYAHDALDTARIVGGVLALSREKDLGTVLDTFMRLTVEVSGATDGILFTTLPHPRRPQALVQRCEAHLGMQDLCVMLSSNDDPSPRDQACAPWPVLDHVLERGTALLVADVTRSDYAQDPWLAKSQALSLMCLPVQRNGETEALLYLANNQTTNAFALQRTEVVQILAAQIGIGLEHAHLISRLSTANTTLTNRNHELAEALAQAKAASQAKAIFLANMSHELRTPLNGVLGMAELLGDSPLAPDQQAMLAALRASGEAIFSAITSILDLAELESGEGVLHPTAFDPQALVRDCCQRYRQLAHAKGLSFSIHHDLAQNTYFFADADRIRRILEALVDNACKFTARGQIQVNLNYAPENSDGGALGLVVSDTGCGIEPMRRAALFHSFEQGDASTTKQYRGLGVGLAMVKRSLTMLRGRIDLNSIVGQGTAAHVWIPVRAAKSQARSQKRAVKPPPRAVSKQILLAEDDPVNQRLLVHMLKRLGYTATVAKNGLEALRLYRDQPALFDVVLMDCQMPVMDGYEAAASIRAHEQSQGSARALVVAVTANALASDRDRCLGAGMDDYISKPVTSEQLRSLLERLGFGAHVVEDLPAESPTDLPLESPDKAQTSLRNSA